MVGISTVHSQNKAIFDAVVFPPLTPKLSKGGLGCHEGERNLPVDTCGCTHSFERVPAKYMTHNDGLVAACDETCITSNHVSFHTSSIHCDPADTFVQGEFSQQNLPLANRPCLSHRHLVTAAALPLHVQH